MRYAWDKGTGKSGRRSIFWPVSQFLCDRTREDNADAYLKREVMERGVVDAITGGKLDFGPWERIFCAGFDEGRRKWLLVKVIFQ